MDAVAQTSSSPSGKFYQALYADELLEALKMSGECARVAFNGTAGESSQQKWDRFVERLSNGDMVAIICRLSSGCRFVHILISTVRGFGRKLHSHHVFFGEQDDWGAT
jgi:hypothetical protein